MLVDFCNLTPVNQFRCISRKTHVDSDCGRKEYFRRYRSLNPDKFKQYLREHRSHNPDKITEYHRQYVRKYLPQNKDKLKLSKSVYYVQNSIHIRDSQRKYRTRNFDRSKESNRQHYFRNLENPDLFLPQNSYRNSWKTPECVRDYFDSIAKQLSICNVDDWYRISRHQVRSFSGVLSHLSLFIREGVSLALSQKFENLGTALLYAYPEIQWNQGKFSTICKKSQQRLLAARVREILPDIEIIEDYQNSDLFRKRPIEIDIWIPQFQVGLEYQGVQHYSNLENAFGPYGTVALYSERDVTKVSLCQLHGITLIVIPYWWDGSKNSLAAILHDAFASDREMSLIEIDRKAECSLT